MTEIYSFLEQGPDTDFQILSVIALVVSLIILIPLIFRQIRAVAAKGFFGTGFFGTLFVILFLIALNVFLRLGVNSDRQTYAEYTEIMQSESYLYEKGRPENAEIFKNYTDDDGESFYDVVFELNGREFNTADIYGALDLTKDEASALKNSETVEVKYVEDDGCDCILEISIA